MALRIQLLFLRRNSTTNKKEMHSNIDLWLNAKRTFNELACRGLREENDKHITHNARIPLRQEEWNMTEE